ncbi:hypothetical protein ACFE04_024740 [Oxalis oulophora]
MDEHAAKSCWLRCLHSVRFVGSTTNLQFMYADCLSVHSSLTSFRKFSHVGCEHKVPLYCSHIGTPQPRRIWWLKVDVGGISEFYREEWSLVILVTYVSGMRGKGRWFGKRTSWVQADTAG